MVVGVRLIEHLAETEIVYTIAPASKIVYD